MAAEYARLANEEAHIHAEKSSVLEIMGTNVSTTHVTCLADPTKTLGVKLPIMKNLKKDFTLEIQAFDDKEVRRRFRASDYQNTTRVKPFICTMPMRLDEGWNQIQCYLPDLTRRAYGTNYCETLRVQLHANCRTRRIYSSDRRFRASNYLSTTRVKPFICTMPMRLDEGWNQIQFNLSEITRRAYRLYSEEELPPEFKLFKWPDDALEHGIVNGP